MSDEDYDIAGWLAGVQGGYNYQSGNAVFGVEADLALAGITGHSEFDESRTDVNWLGTVRGRLGFAADKFFIYGTAGVAAAGVETWLFDRSSSGVRYGWVAGLGAEMMVADNVSIKAEYLFHDFGSRRLEFHDPDGHITDRLSLSTVKIGLNVHF